MDMKRGAHMEMESAHSILHGYCSSVKRCCKGTRAQGEKEEDGGVDDAVDELC